MSRLPARTIDGVIYGVDIDREENTIAFVARLPLGTEFDITEEFAMKRRLHDGMRAALLPIFEKYSDEKPISITLPQAARGADTSGPSES